MKMSNRCKRILVHAVGVTALGVAHGVNGNLGECTGEPGKCGCTHAEIDLLSKMPNPFQVYVSHSPCLACAKALVRAGVRIVDYALPYRLPDGIEYLRDHGVIVRRSI
jgi:deoxycytidylate deaminase